MTVRHALLFDLDGTLVDTVYPHVLAWQRALAEVGLPVDGFRLHHRIGSSGELIIRHAQRDAAVKLSAKDEERVHRRHAEMFHQLVPTPRPLPGAVQALRTLAAAKVPQAVATASYRPIIDPALRALEVPSDTLIVEGTGELHGKPEPDLFLACRERLGLRSEHCIVVGDSIWDHIGARRAGMMSIGVLTGGYGAEELFHAGAFQVYRDVAELLRNLDDIGLVIE